ncbi:tRNA nucleotidyltransferase [Pseudomonas phage Stalingrad]|uniref:tRNA nucleotidyltransferase n=1 Tax=Pseudomonas phage Stalingrad TaxID=2762287 RepID=A0A7G8LJ62_9CAUD|nr:tRNA nucleotidyltransferase [Pseudomonas phage Stalingrad]
MSVTRDQVIQAINLRDQLEALGFSVVIGGGFARDVYFGEPPNCSDWRRLRP